MGVVIGQARFIDRLARRYISLYKNKGSQQAKKWALEFLAPEPRRQMVERVNEIKKAASK